MQRILTVAMAVLIPLAMASNEAAAKAFEPEFTIVNVTGEVRVKVPGAKKSAKAGVGEAYPYGTTLETMRNASAVIRFSEKNICRVSARTKVVVKQGTSNKKMKKLDLTIGKLDLEMKGIVSGESLLVETASAVCGITGTEVSMEATRDKDVNATVIKLKSDTISVNGEHYRIEEMRENSEIVVSMTDDKDYIRIRIVRGEMQITVRDEDGKKDIGIDDGDLVKIFSRRSDDGLYEQITILIYDGADGGEKLVQTLQYTRKLLDTGTGGEEPGGEEPGTGEPFKPPRTTVTTQSGGTTTTTTPSPTPPGLR